MANSDRPKPVSKPAAGSVPAPDSDRPAGRIIHDERGNAVWDWVAETARVFIGNTSRLLRRLETPELKMEEEKSEQELRLESDRDAGGGYDPYGRSSSGNAGGRAGGSRTSGVTTTESRHPEGGYDPYSKGAPRKPRGKL